MSNKFFSAMAKAAYLSTFLTVLLLPGIAMAEEEGKKGDGFDLSVFGPLGGIAKTVWNWIEPFLTLDTKWEYWWIIFFTIPLTFVWQWKSSEGGRKFFNDLGGYVVCGTGALAVLLGFVAPFLGAVMVIIGVVTQLIGLSLNLSFTGLLSMIWTLIKLIPFFLIIWIITKIPGLQGLIERWISLGKTIAARIWAHHQEVKQKPGLGWAIAGGLLVALVINGNYMMHVTKKFAFSGLIPIISGVVGIVFFIYRTVPGNKIKNRMLKQAPPGWWYCDLVADKPLYDEKLWEKTGEVKPIPNADGSQKWKKNHKCGALNKPEFETCCRPYCNNTPGWTCPKCGYKGEDVVIAETPPEKEGGKPKKETIKQGISWKVKNCPKCHTAQPARPKRFHFPTEDLFSAPEPVLPTDDSTAAPTTTATAAAATATTAPTGTAGVAPAATAATAAPATADAPEASAEAEAEGGQWLQCSCGEMNFLHKNPQFCEVCGGKLPELTPANRAESKDELPTCPIPSFYEIWWYIP